MSALACRLAAAAIIALGVSGGAQAQSAQEFYKGRQLTLVVGYEVGNDYDVGARLLAKHLTKQLNLSADQQTKLKPILEDQRKQMEAVHNDSSLSREDRFSKMQALRQSSDADIKGVLNEEQQKNFDKMRAEQHDRMKNWHKDGGGAPPAGDSQQ